ncbi:neugrin [Fukomys damarensis]|uniref:neugrin n=1 Tax=Fukomys damarensis TaxID=885580 RepID=UPI00053F9E31|nr:neugrin [Fukomys damarensis]
MAATLTLLLAGRGRAAVARCGFVTRGLLGPGPTGREPDPDSDWEPEERELQELESTLKRQKKTIRLQKIRRQMEPPGPPPRTLTREAMDQIRYLHKEFADSWSVARLAEGFDVSTDVIRRVLKSKFVPTVKQKLKQDEKVLKRAGLAHSMQQLQSSEDSRKSLAAGHVVMGSLLKASSRGQSHSTALTVLEASTQSTDAQQKQEGRNKGSQSLGKRSFVPDTIALDRQRKPKSSTSDCAGTRSTDSNGFLSDKKLEECKADELGDQNFSSKVVQRGREFFDSNGNFLYRI